MRRSLPAFALAATLLAAPAAHAQPPGQPAAAATPAFSVDGFRHARFGMTPSQVEAAIQADFGPLKPAIRHTSNPLERTTAVEIQLPALEPGPGAATVAYIFGAVSKRLTHVNIVWATGPAPTPQERTAMSAAGVELVDYFQARPSRPKAVVEARPQGSGVILYAAADEKGAGLEVYLDGVSLGGAAGAPAKGPVALRMSYEANVVRPDVYQVPANAY